LHKKQSEKKKKKECEDQKRNKSPDGKRQPDKPIMKRLLFFYTKSRRTDGRVTGYVQPDRKSLASTSAPNILKSIIVSRGNVAHKWSETEKSCRRLYVS
jgi:hypothetical protein